MWLKLLYFFRYSKQTSYLIRMIANVMVEIVVFLMVLLITIISFGDAFIPLQKETNPLEFNPDDSYFWFVRICLERFIASFFFTYSMILGNVGLDGFDTAQIFTASILVVTCTLFVMIVMLNLLIAIVN